MAYRNELLVDKLLVWNTDIPYQDKPRRSPDFSLMGSEWYLEFTYKKGTGFHVLSLNRAIAVDIPQQLEFRTRTHITNMEIYDLKYNQVGVLTANVYGEADTILWNAGQTDDCIFNILPSLHRSSEIQFVCLFCGQPPSAFQLEIGTDTPKLVKTVLTEGPSDRECLSSDLTKLLEGEQLSDVRLNCCGHIFPAHRSVLAARSEVFAAMFRNKMSESETGGVDVKDFEPDVVRQFLQYVYSGKMSAESGDAVTSLFAMADKYAVDSLKRACTEWIVGNLAEENCIQYLAVADLHGSGPLKDVVAAFICGHPAIMLSEKWVELSEKNPKLTFEVHQSFVRSKTGT